MNWSQVLQSLLRQRRQRKAIHSPAGVIFHRRCQRFASEKWYDKNKIETELEHLGFEEGTNDRKKKYKVLEIKKYNVDKDFPKITLDSFVNKQMPTAVVQFSYTIDLDAVKNEDVVSL